MPRWSNPKSVYLSDPVVCAWIRNTAKESGKTLTDTVGDLVARRLAQLRAEQDAETIPDQPPAS